jgi:hypothetical protein
MHASTQHYAGHTKPPWLSSGSQQARPSASKGTAGAPPTWVPQRAPLCNINVHEYQMHLRCVLQHTLTHTIHHTTITLTHTPTELQPQPALVILPFIQVPPHAIPNTTALRPHQRLCTLVLASYTPHSHCIIDAKMAPAQPLAYQLSSDAACQSLSSQCLHLFVNAP